jgi:hypothetical protein
MQYTLPNELRQKAKAWLGKFINTFGMFFLAGIWKDNE